MIMRDEKIKNILAIGMGLLLIMPPVGFAEGKTLWGDTPTQAYSHEVPALSQEDASQAPQSSKPNPATFTQVSFSKMENDSPLSLSSYKPAEIPQKLTEEESAAVLGRTNELIRMALDSLKTQREGASAKSGEAPTSLNNEIKKYEEAQAILDAYSKEKAQSASTELPLMRPTAYDTLQAVDNKVGAPGPKIIVTESPLSDSPVNLIPRVVRYVADSIQKVREQMTDNASLPAAKVFSAEESPNASSVERGAQHEERPVLSRGVDKTVKEHYQVLGSVVLNRETAKTYELLNPPQKLHPFLRWLLYGRHLTQVRAEQYLAARDKVQEICLRAKAGEGLIRYKGKVMGMFLPLPGDETGGAFELVRRM